MKPDQLIEAVEKPKEMFQSHLDDRTNPRLRTILQELIESVNEIGPEDLRDVPDFEKIRLTDNALSEILLRKDLSKHPNQTRQRLNDLAVAFQSTVMNEQNAAMYDDEDIREIVLGLLSGCFDFGVRRVNDK